MTTLHILQCNGTTLQRGYCPILSGEFQSKSRVPMTYNSSFRPTICGLQIRGDEIKFTFVSFWSSFNPLTRHYSLESPRFDILPIVTVACLPLVLCPSSTNPLCSPPKSGCRVIMLFKR